MLKEEQKEADGDVDRFPWFKCLILLYLDDFNLFYNCL